MCYNTTVGEEGGILKSLDEAIEMLDKTIINESFIDDLGNKRYTTDLKFKARVKYKTIYNIGKERKPTRDTEKTIYVYDIGKEDVQRMLNKKLKQIDGHLSANITEYTVIERYVKRNDE